MQRHLSHRHHGAARLLSSSLLPRMNSSSGPPAAQQQQQHLLMSSPLPPSPFHLHFHRRYSNGVIFSLRGLAVHSDIDTAVAVTNGEYCQCGSGRSNKLFEQLPTTKIRRQKRSSSSSKSTTGTGVGGNDRNIVASSGGSEPLSNYIAGRIIRKNNQQQQQSHSRINGTILRLDEQTNNDHSTQHRHHLNTSATIPPSQLRMHQRLPRHPNIPVHSLGKSTLSATDLHRWYLNQQREEKEKEREKYNQHQLQAAVDHQSIMKRGHNLGGGSIVALQSATVKYRQLRQRQQQRQHQISETKNDCVISAINVSDGTSSSSNSHQLKTNPSAKTIPISNDDDPVRHSSEHLSKSDINSNVETDGSTSANKKNCWFASWFAREKKE